LAFWWDSTVPQPVEKPLTLVKVPYNDPGLTQALSDGAPGAAASPWVAAIVNAGIGARWHLPQFLTVIH
jgi:amino acid permease